MSVTSGDFFDDKKLTFAGGAPRSNGTGWYIFKYNLWPLNIISNKKILGQVIFYNKSSKSNLFDHRATLHGEQFASSFGYTMVTLDCDGDGLVYSNWFIDLDPDWMIQFPTDHINLLCD